MARRIEKKILPEYFDAIASGKKTFEFRLADFDVEEGDTLVLVEYDSMNEVTRKPTGRTMEKTVTYVKKFMPNEFDQQKEITEKGFYVISIK